MTVPTWERASALMLAIFLSRVWARWRTALRARADMSTPLVDAALLEAVFAPRPRDGDDPNLLAEMRDTFLHLNRRAYAEEFWGLHAQLVTLYGTLGEAQQATLRRALVRLLTANDRWLQLVGAKTSAALHVSEAVPPLRALLETGRGAASDEDKRYVIALQDALAALTA